MEWGKWLGQTDSRWTIHEMSWLWRVEDGIGPVLAKTIANNLGMSGKWQTLDREALALLDEGKWIMTHSANEWQPLEAAVGHDVQSYSIKIDL